MPACEQFGCLAVACYCRDFRLLGRKDAFRMSIGLYAHGHFSGVTNMTFPWPNLCKYVNQWLRQWAPKNVQWSTVNILFNMESKPHRDIHNLKGRLNYLITFGDHQQGERWVEGPAPEGQGRSKKTTEARWIFGAWSSSSTSSSGGGVLA